MPSLLAAMQGSRPLLWLDADAYAGRLLAPGSGVPWIDTSAFVAWQRKAQGLLKSDVVALPVEAVLAAYLTSDATLRAAIEVKPRLLFALKTFLAADAPRAKVADLLRGLRSVFPALPLVIRIPSPRRWIRLAHEQAGHTLDGSIEPDDVDSGAMYIADFLRSFGDCGVDALLIEEDLASEPASEAELELYQPVLNVARHFRWICGLKLSDDSTYQGATTGLDFAIGPATAGSRKGVLVDEAFWDAGPVPSVGKDGFRYACIPQQSKPELVLERLKALR